MKIEEFPCETVPSEEFTDEARALVDKLGAGGQLLYYQQDAPPIAYRKMTPVEYAVYKTLLPRRESIEKYKSGPIPLRVLQIAAHARECLTGELVIWHPGEGKDDPLLTMREGNEYSGTYYLLARWANELEEFSVLLERAVKQMAAAVKAELLSKQNELNVWLATCEDQVRARLMVGKTDTPSVHWF